MCFLTLVFISEDWRCTVVVSMGSGTRYLIGLRALFTVLCILSCMSDKYIYIYLMHSDPEMSCIEKYKKNKITF